MLHFHFFFIIILLHCFLYFYFSQIFGMRVLKRFRGIEGIEGSKVSAGDSSIGSRIRGVERLYVYDQDTLDLKAKPIAVIKSNFSMKKIE